jgi:predicted ATPase
MISPLFTGPTPDDAFDEAIFQASGGNPLYVEEVLKDMASRGLITMEHGEWRIAPFEKAKPPSSLEDAIRQHLQKLDPETADVVASAAVIGSNFRVDVLQDITGRNEGYTLEILDKAMRASVVAPEYTSAPPSWSAQNIYSPIIAPITDFPFFLGISE